MAPDARDNLGDVVGVWSDRNQSVYVVERNPDGWSCSVQTTRKSGEKRFTKGLIRASQGRVNWGQNYMLDGDRTTYSTLHWVHLNGGRHFEWLRSAADAAPFCRAASITQDRAASLSGACRRWRRRRVADSSSMVPSLSWSQVGPVPLQEENSKTFPP
ncbi:unnamed protein product [Prorocentrum cordatum]|uniref:Uncharacterized protein n=1 Tax=Prorocentrum cordatum TaxID=2364126 RepID=A0ABN9Q899_9DINO|nr:unnamed protein product [Polarella glacialis]